MSTLKNNFDSIEQMIFQRGLRISTVEIKPTLKLFYVFLNNGKVIIEPIEKYERLKGKSNDSLLNVEIIANGSGIHWPTLDEDISLKGILIDLLTNNILPPGGGNNDFAMAA